MNRKFLILTTAVLSLGMAVSGTLAYFTDQGTAHNIITTGGVDIELVETHIDANGQIGNFPEQGISGIMPGMDISKIVRIKNTGPAAAWVRVKVDTVINMADNTDNITDAAGRQPAQDMITIDFNTTDWIKDGDFYYYHQSLAPDQQTTPLFTQISFHKNMDNPYQNCTVDVRVSAQATQTANNDIPQGGSIVNVKGWPDNDTAAPGN